MGQVSSVKLPPKMSELPNVAGHWLLGPGRSAVECEAGSSAGRAMPDGATPRPGGWNRIHLIVDDLDTEVTRLRDAGARFRNDIVEGPGGKQILLQDPSGNVVELFQPANA